MARKRKDIDDFLNDILDVDVARSRINRQTNKKPKKLTDKALPSGNGAVMATRKKFDVRGLTDYIKAINDFPMSTKLEPGKFYSYGYQFDKGAPYDQLRFYDYHPLTYIYWVGKSKSGKPIAMGINFHRLPVQIRYTLINKIFKAENVDPTTVTARKRLKQTYETLKPFLKKIKFAVRMYRIDRMRKTRTVHLRYVRQLLTFYPETLYKATIRELFDEYLQFKP